MNSATRSSLHAICEWLLAGPQHARSDTVRLRVTDAGFSTSREPAIELTSLGLTAEGRTVPVVGTISEIATAANLPLGRPRVDYHDPVPAEPDTVVQLDPAAFAALHTEYLIGRDALLRFQPDEPPVLWPEHLDVAIRFREINFGVAPPDSAMPEAYAYVGPDQVNADPFWNLPFGAALPIRELTGSDRASTTAAAVEFFREGWLGLRATVNRATSPVSLPRLP